MRTIIHFLRLLSIVIWVGGLIFFAFVLAPAAFHLLPTQHIAGLIVGGTLRWLDVIGLGCGAIFIITTVVLSPRIGPTRFDGKMELLLAVLMLLATGYLHGNILPAMERDRVAAGGEIEQAPSNLPAKQHFERLHSRSEQIEGAVLFCGLGIVFLVAQELSAKER